MFFNSSLAIKTYSSNAYISMFNYLFRISAYFILLTASLMLSVLVIFVIYSK